MSEGPEGLTSASKIQSVFGLKNRSWTALAVLLVTDTRVRWTRLPYAIANGTERRPADPRFPLLLLWGK